ncbi:MAG: glycoside hydrolase domain-containing protein [Bacteroidales bacterium]
MNFKSLRSACTLIAITGMLLLAFSSCDWKRPKKEFITFQEMQDPTNDTLSDWSNVKAGLHSSFISIDVRAPKSVAPEVEIKKSEKVTGWKGEKVSAQMILWTTADVDQVELEFDDFISESATLPASIAQARFVRYVMTDEFAEGCGHRKPEDYAASISADMLDNLDNFNIEAKTVRPVWLTIDIPSDAVAGNYKGKLNLYAERKFVEDFEIKVEVVNQLLPEPSEWVYHLDLWQHPSAVARVHNLELWSDAHFEKMRPIMKMLADAGQKVITATLNKDPWNHQSFDAYADMIIWTKNEDQSWSFDYTVFDKWVEFMMDLGVTDMINCYSLLTWNNQVHYNDMEKKELVTLELKAQSDEYAEFWTVFLKDFTRHLKAKGWLEITNIAMDERSPADMQAALKVLETAAPELGISLADNHKSYKQYPGIKDISVGANSVVDKEDIITRRAEGLNTTWYVCCADPFANMFTFSAPAEAVYAGWHTVAADLDGMLRWAYNSWVENPLTDSRYKTWPAGDTYMVYPDARSSIRFERLIEGIQDAEKIRILRKQYSDENTSESLAKLNELEEAIKYFYTLEPSDDWNDKLNEAKKLLNR